MPSSLFYLTTRLSPQTTGVKIVPPGGLPEVTREDVLRAIGMVHDAISWQCIAAKWLGDQKAADGLVKTTEICSWRKWLEQKQPAKIDVFTHQKLAELAFLEWMYPDNCRTDIGSAKYLGCSVKTYRANFHGHQNLIERSLHDAEAKGWREIKEFLFAAA